MLYTSAFSLSATEDMIFGKYNVLEKNMGFGVENLPLNWCMTLGCSLCSTRDPVHEFIQRWGP